MKREKSCIFIMHEKWAVKKGLLLFAKLADAERQVSLFVFASLQNYSILSQMRCFTALYW